MNLELSREEADDLSRVLDQYLSEFHDEIAHTDREDVRAQFHATYDRLRELKDRVDALSASSTQPHA